MKRFIAGVAVLAFLGSCGNKKARMNPFAAITSEIDSVIHKKDTLLEENKFTGPIPIEADDSFDDFIYTFASDDALQRQRVLFPLPYYNGEALSKIEENHWKHDDLFTKQSFYTLLFEREEDMDLVGGNALTSVQVEWIFMPKRMVKRYYFERIKGLGYSNPFVCNP